MPNTKPWHRLWLIIVGLAAFCPLGLLMLWTSPRSLRAKAGTTAIALVLVLAAVFAIVSTGVYDRLLGSPDSDQMYDFTLNERGRYRTPQILEFEREVFGAVVRELRRISTIRTPSPLTEETPTENISPETLAFEKVADEYGLDPEDVIGIYSKVSSRLAQSRK